MTTQRPLTRKKQDTTTMSWYPEHIPGNGNGRVQDLLQSYKMLPKTQFSKKQELEFQSYYLNNMQPGCVQNKGIKWIQDEMKRVKKTKAANKNIESLTIDLAKVSFESI